MNYEKAWDFFEKKDEVNAYKYFFLSKNEFLNASDSVGAGKSLMNSSIILLNQGDYYGSEETNSQALKYFKDIKSSEEYVFSIYNTIAISRNNLKDYKTALSWYTKALNLSKDSLEKIKIRNNIAVALSKSGDYKQAIEILKKIETSPKINEDYNIQSKIIDNLAFTQYQQNPNYNALPKLTQALQIREKENDLWGQNASHAHLSDYFSKKDNTQALFHAKKMLSIATQLNSPDDRLEALQKLVLLEKPENSKTFFLQYQKLNDSLQTARAKAKNQFALIRYETEKEKAENARKQNHILKQNIVIGTLIFGLFGGFFIYKRRKKRVQQENEIKVKNTQIKYSRRVHDVVANGLYHTMMQIQNNPDFSKEQTLNDIEKMYEESRDIARDDLDEIIEKDFAKRLYEMLNSYSSENQKVLVVGNDQEKWRVISSNAQTEIYYVLREAMVNMVKHSRAKLTSIIIESSEKQILVKYTDNGIGISSSEKKSGIRNMENRIATIGGTFIFEKNPNDGLIIQITIPIQ